ncbi:FapA family protein [Mangrovibacillus cuniculi]|uniref:DUF342 domain-containing protein n=1 Tax=Mangrovibacillus cuniculi TaxID=2593652 RepID=A0A7S8CBM1_9BACI|nr:FapA family protein [Mangrovibacillus cuniculi]QPC46813.1 DUF342 domain-containing protein [Mangrovibacillus cuniculi]
MDVLMENDYFQLLTDEINVYILVKQSGFPLLQLNHSLKDHPRISLTNFLALKKALEKPSEEFTLIGEWKSLVDIMITSDKMKAFLTVNVPEEEWIKRESEIQSKINYMIEEYNIRTGISSPNFKELKKQPDGLLLAEGVAPINGEDAKIEYKPLPARTPMIKDDGNADYYDLHFVEEVFKGDWLGEKTPSTPGKNGNTIFGDVLLALSGEDKPLLYDPETVHVVSEEGKWVLRALQDGILERKNGRLSIGKHLLIDGDVGIETGNIEFDGTVTVKGTVMSGYAIKATKDLSILSDLGVSNAKSIITAKGDIFIKGGIFGKSGTIVESGRHIYLKHANECQLHAKGDIFIGNYAIGCDLNATNVLADERKGSIIGGKIVAVGKVCASSIGNKLERKTSVHVKGFQRKMEEEALKVVLLEYRELLIELEQVKKEVQSFPTDTSKLTEGEKVSQKKKRQELKDLQQKLTRVDDKRKHHMNMLSIKGEGEVSAKAGIFPQTLIEIGPQQKYIRTLTKGTYYLLDRQLRFE